MTTSVLICTRNRACAIVVAVRSVLADPSPSFELLVVDQSDGTDTAEALRSFAEDPRFRVIASESRGKGLALNEGLAAAKGDVVLCTDDDCEAQPGWISNMTSVLLRNPATGVVFGNVISPPHDSGRGYVPTFERDRPRRLTRLSQACHGNGHGMGDGEIEPTFRWRQQMQGAHADNLEFNQHGIGVCLVGNFENHRPTSSQLVAVKRLVGVLKSEYHIHGDQVVGHRDVKKSTECPGKLFPLSEVAQANDLPVFGSRAEMLPPQFVQAQGGSTE